MRPPLCLRPSASAVLSLAPALLLLSALVVPSRAAPDPVPAAPLKQAATAEPPEELPRAKATDLKAIRALLGKKAVITGHIAKTHESGKGITFLNFEGGQFTAVAWKETYAKFEGGSPAGFYRDRTVEITGRIEEYRAPGTRPGKPGQLQIRLTSPEQIKILDGKSGSGEAGQDSDSRTPGGKTEDSGPQKGNKTDGPAGGEGCSPDGAPPPGAKKAAPGRKPSASPEKPGSGNDKDHGGGTPAERVDPKKYFR